MPTVSPRSQGHAFLPHATIICVLTKLLVLVRAQRLEACPVQGLPRLPQGLAQRVQPFPDHARHAAVPRVVECPVCVWCVVVVVWWAG